MHRDDNRERVFLTFATHDLPQARPIVADLLAGGGVSLDQALTSEPFATARGDIVRASLLRRLRHCTSALCLYGKSTFEDDWVRWSLTAAAELSLPLFGAPLPGEDARDAEICLTRMGAELVPLSHDAIAESARAAAAPHRRSQALTAAAIGTTLHLLRYPIC